MQLREDANTPFRDRREAGHELAEVLAQLDLEEPVVVALPRGGVPVAFEVAQELGAPLDILLVRKLGAPQNPELAVGAISEDGQVILDGDTIASLGISRDQLGGTIARERLELERRRSSYRGETLPIEVRGRTVL
ncbi:MAG: phosphoribosyltransferase, partial [Thermoleophilia bacterium]|nr:phosphoribosyltransferase [Thermoleophilia bacterium]